MRLFSCLVIGVVLIAGSFMPKLSAQVDPTIYIVTYIDAAPSSQQQVAAALKRLADASRADGPIRFEAAQRATEPNQFLLLEVWKDQQALDAHRTAAHTTQFREQLRPLLMAPPDERLCVPTMVAPASPGRAAVYVVTHVDVPGNSRENAISLLKTLTERTRAEAGNVRFDVVHQRDRTNHFSVIAVWSDQKSDDAHQLAAHTKEFRSQITPLLGALYDQRVYKPL